MTKRVFNFNPGPAVLPLEVLETAQSELLDFKGTGMSVMEISHRSKEFEAVIQTAEGDLRELLGIPANYKIIFLQGGASLQFAMLPMELRAQQRIQKRKASIACLRISTSTRTPHTFTSHPMKLFMVWNISVNQHRLLVFHLFVTHPLISSATRWTFRSMRCCTRVLKRMPAPQA